MSLFAIGVHKFLLQRCAELGGEHAFSQGLITNETGVKALSLQNSEGKVGI